MLDQPGRTRNTPQFSPQSEPPRQGAIARFFAVAKTLAGYGFVLMFFVMAGEKLFAPEYKPSTLMGRFAGATETAEIAAKQKAAVEFTRLQAEAQAVAQANAAKKAEIIGDTEGFKGFAAGVADALCIAGQVFGTPKNPEAQSLKQACGVGDQIRNGMARDLDRAGQAAPVN